MNYTQKIFTAYKINEGGSDNSFAIELSFKTCIHYLPKMQPYINEIQTYCYSFYWYSSVKHLNQYESLYD